MTACWPDFYTKIPFRVKRRLQVTANPMVSATAQDKIRSGVVDVDAALLDPTKEYVNHSETARNDISWCENSGVGVLANGDEKTIDFTKVHRIKRIKQKNSNTQYTDSWVVYIQGSSVGEGVVEKIGPINSITKQDDDLSSMDSLIKIRGAQTGLKFINDLLLSEPIDQVESCANNEVALLSD
jgi:hypothetical protein